MEEFENIDLLTILSDSGLLYLFNPKMKERMFIIYGKRTLRVKSYTDHAQQCSNCKSLDMQVAVSKNYFHIFFIPFFPTGIKTSKLWCRACGQLNRIDSLQAQYEKTTKNPFYLYSGLILVGVLILFIASENIKTQKEKKEFVKNPAVGDVYLIREDRDKQAAYYFLRISSIQGDTIGTYHSNFEYNRFITDFQNDDYFVEDEMIFFTRNELIQMLEKDEINSVERGYGTSKGFNRIK